jgi:hypothetical protein
MVVHLDVYASRSPQMRSWCMRNGDGRVEVQRAYGPHRIWRDISDWLAIFNHLSSINNGELI